MKKIVFLIIIIFLFFPTNVVANVMCNDGTMSPSCAVCSQGCCSHHGGCASGTSKKRDNYNSKMNKYSNQNSNDLEDDYSYIPWVLLALGMPLVIGMIKKLIKISYTHTTEDSNASEKSEFELFYDKVDNIKKIVNEINIIEPNKKIYIQSVKYDKISFYYKNKKISCICFAKNEVELYQTLNSEDIYFKSSGRKVVMQNLSKNSAAFELYKKEIFDYSLCATFYSSDVTIYDYNKQIRNLYGFRAEKITTANIARSKRKIEDAKEYKFKMLIRNINLSEELEITMNLEDLIKFSKLCQSIPIIEDEYME